MEGLHLSWEGTCAVEADASIRLVERHSRGPQHCRLLLCHRLLARVKRRSVPSRLLLHRRLLLRHPLLVCIPVPPRLLLAKMGASEVGEGHGGG